MLNMMIYVSYVYCDLS